MICIHIIFKLPATDDSVVITVKLEVFIRVPCCFFTVYKKLASSIIRIFNDVLPYILSELYNNCAIDVPTSKVRTVPNSLLLTQNIRKYDAVVVSSSITFVPMLVKIDH
jgi:hypothetical protein